MKRKELMDLEKSDGNNLVNSLVNCKNEIEKMVKKISAYDEDIEIEEQKIKVLMENLKTIEDDLEKSRSKYLERVEIIKKSQKEIGLEWDADYYEILENRNKTGLDILSDRYEEHKKNIEELMKLIITLDHIEKEITDIDRRLEEERKKVETYRKKIKELELVNTKELMKFIEIFDNSYRELKIDYKVVREFQELAEELTDDYNAKKDVVDLFERVRNYKKDELHKELGKYERSIEKLQEEIDEKEKDKNRLESSKDSEIELLAHKRENREKAKKQGKGILPFYKCVAFKDGIEDSVKGKIERGLWEIGILDALVR